jgi:glycosyltransferase involved in cell wall biosynthesis
VFTVSVIIPTYNRCQLLRRALLSIYKQKIQVDEVIVIDDGSTDDTRKMLGKEFPDVKYTFQENAGVSAARNMGVRQAKGEWLAFLDSDDEWLPDKLEKQLESLENNPDMRICHSDEIWKRNGVRVNPMNKHNKKGGWIFQHCLPLCAMSPSSIIIHCSVFAQVGLFDLALPACEDYDLWLRITARYPVLFIDHPLIVKYGGHEDQLSCKYWGMDRFRIAALEKILVDDFLAIADQRAATQMLIKKASIYLQGAEKRNKREEVVIYQQLLDRYASSQ